MSCTEGMYSILERCGERHGHMRRADHLDRCPQVAEGLGHHLRGDVGGQVAPRACLVHDDEAAGVFHRLQDRVQVERADRAWIDDFGRNTG